MRASVALLVLAALVSCSRDPGFGETCTNVCANDPKTTAEYRLGCVKLPEGRSICTQKCSMAGDTLQIPCPTGSRCEKFEVRYAGSPFGGVSGACIPDEHR